jgi:hypothetical protein
MATKRTKPKPRSTVDDTVRAAISAKLAAGGSLNRLAKEAGYADHSQLARYYRGQRGLATGPKFDGLLRVLGLRVS